MMQWEGGRLATLPHGEMQYKARSASHVSAPGLAVSEVG